VYVLGNSNKVPVEIFIYFIALSHNS